MTGHIKVSGVWQNITAPSVKIAGTWKQVIQAWTKVGGSWVQWYIATITDTFTRANTGSGLGTSDSGALWSAIRGVFFINSNKAKSTDTPSTYPIATVDAGVTTPSISLDIDAAGGGVGASFWVSDTQNWYGVFPYVTTSTSYGQSCATYSQTGPGYTCGQVNGPFYGQQCTNTQVNYGQQCTNPFTSYGQACSNPYTSYGQACQQNDPYFQTSGSSCSAWVQTSQFVCTGYVQRYDGFRGYWYSACGTFGTNYGQQCSQTTTTYGIGGGACIAYYQTSSSGCGGSYYQTSSSGCGGSYTQTVGYSCIGSYVQTGPGYSCGVTNGPFYGSACASYTQTSVNSAGQVYLRLIRSVANTVSTLVDQAISALPESIQVLISGNQITARAFSGVGQTTQIGSDLVNTPSSPITATQHGLIIAPGGYNQGTTADNLTVSAVQ